MKQNSFKIIVVILVVVILAIIVVLAKNTSPADDSVTRTPELEAFNTCLSDSGAKFYGAIWCPHCGEQKRILGYSKIETPPTYIECSPVAGSPLLPICEAAKIESFPTWDFADGTRQTGTLSIEMLSEKTSCELDEPGSVATGTESSE